MSSSSLSTQDIALVETFAKSARRSALQMVTNAQSGHPGGAFSTMDFLALVYTQIIAKTGEDIIISNGHISPAVYGVLAEMGYIDKEDVVKNFRQFGSDFEGHITRHVPGVIFGTGPLGAGVSVASGYALAEKRASTTLGNQAKRVFATIGDGEAQEGQVYETLLFAAKEKLNNFIVFVDWNRVQLTASLEDIMPTDLEKIFSACGWNVAMVDGHNADEMMTAIENTGKNEKPTVLIGKTIMGKGAEFMEVTGRNIQSTWHGKAPSQEICAEALANELLLTAEDEILLENFRNTIQWKPAPTEFTKKLSKIQGLSSGTPIVYEAHQVADCRGAYGKALLSLGVENKEVFALTADVGGSVMTKFLEAEKPEQHVQMGIMEQAMVSVSGGLSMKNIVPFCSTFGAFMSSRAKDQARLNDINQTNVKMVATHCGLSVGEDGPTHQAIDDMGSFLGMFNTHICEPADPNHCDRIIRYVGTHYGNFYVRMGRHKVATLTKENGEIFYGADYQYEYGKCDLYRQGKGITILATGATVIEAQKAREQFVSPEKVEIVIVSSIKQFDETVKQSLQKNNMVITVEDHNPYSGLYSMVCQYVQNEGIQVEKIIPLSSTQYQLSGTDKALYNAAGINAAGILKAIESLS